MKETIKKSAIPVYAVGILWVLYAVWFPMYRILDFIIATVLSVLVYFVAGKFFPGEKIMVEEKIKDADTGVDEADRIINEGRNAVRTMKKLNLSIESERVSMQIDKLTVSTDRIIDYVEKNPHRAGKLRKFTSYYLPTTIKLLTSYNGLAGQGIEGKNITEAKTGIENILDNVTLAFDKQLDHLFADEAMDISTDITVLEGMIAAEGLNNNNNERIKS